MRISARSLELNMKAVTGFLYGFSLVALGYSRPSFWSTINDYGSLLSLNSSEDPNGINTPTSKHFDGAIVTDTVSQKNKPRMEGAGGGEKLQRYVFAHVIAGNAQNYTKEEWISDMKMARSAHIDAFAINIGIDSSNDVQLPLIYESAQSVGFKVFLSFDMNYYAYAGSSKDIQTRILQFTNHEAQFNYQNKTFISTFSGEVKGTFMDNNQSYTEAWCTLKATLRDIGTHTYFVPGWTGIAPSTSRCADGLLSWDAWPHNTDTVPANFQQINNNLTAQQAMYLPDKVSMEATRAVFKTFAASVSPLFFKHINPRSADNYIYRSDDWMMINRYTHLIKQEVPPEFINILTWNDYGESHYLRDPQPSANLPSGLVSSHQYVDGFSHAALLNLMSYFNQWYKSGQPPKLNQTTLFIWYRPHVKNAVASNDLLPSPAFANNSEDRLYGYVIPSPNTTVAAVRIVSGYQVLEQALLSPSNNLTMKGSTGNQIVEDNSNNNAAEVVGTGILLSAPLEPGNPQVDLMNETGETLVSLQGMEVEAIPQTYNFNYWSGSIAF